jgi:hypothetical protein
MRATPLAGKQGNCINPHNITSLAKIFLGQQLQVIAACHCAAFPALSANLARYLAGHSNSNCCILRCASVLQAV